MSTGSVSESSDSGNDDDSSSLAIGDQLIAAIEAGNVAKVRALLLQVDKDGYRVATDKDIDTALWHAAVEGCVESCRLLWQRLSRLGKRRYFPAGNSIRPFPPLHEAVKNDHLEIVRFFVLECNFNINQINAIGETPLFRAIHSEEMIRFLLENGANPNHGYVFGYLSLAIYGGHTNIVRLLFEYGADPNPYRRPANEPNNGNFLEYLRGTDIAIGNGDIEVLSILLQHGAFIGHDDSSSETSLNELLSNDRIDTTREEKVSICRLLLKHAKVDSATARFMQVSLEKTASLSDNESCEEGLGDNESCESLGDNESCEMLLEAGMDPSTAMSYAIQAVNLPLCQLLVLQYQVDPFAQEGDDSADEHHHAASPFLAAARQPDTSIFEYLLNAWDERYASIGGKNSDGDYPIHVICCDPQVSLEAIQVLVNRQADALATADGEQGLLPFHFAAMWNANLDVIFYLLKHCPNNLRCAGNAAAGQCPLPAAVVGHMNGSTVEESTCNDDDSQPCGRPVKKKAKTSKY